MVVKWAGCVSLGPDAEEARVAPAGGWLGATTMERYGGAFEEAVDGARQQERHYQLLSALQSLVKELPRCAAAGWGGVGRSGRLRRPWVPPALTASLCPQLFPAAPVLHHAQRPGPGAS